MKKHEIEELDEFEEIEEIEEFEESDDEVIDDEDFIDDFSDEAPKSNKPVKKAKKKGKGGIAAIIVVVALLLIVAIAVLVVLPKFGIVIAGLDPLHLAGENPASADPDSYEMKVATSINNSLTASTPISHTMTNFEMMQAALDNYNKATFAANYCREGGVNTKLGPVKVAQSVHSLKVRKGAAGDGAQYFAHSKSAGIANMIEEYYMTATGAIKYRKASGAEKLDDGTIKASGWNKVEAFDNLDKFMAAKTTDFTQFWSYMVTEDTVTPESKTQKPGLVKDETNGNYYSFIVAVDITNEAAIADYKEVMAYQLSNNLGMQVNDLRFTKLEFKFTVWENGFLRTLAISESYEMDLAKVPVVRTLKGMGIDNIYINEYWFDESIKAPYDSTGVVEQKTLADLMKLF